MSARGTYIEGHTVYLDDAHGWPTHVPATRLPALLGEAKRSDDETAVFGLRHFHRDALQGAYDLLPQCDSCGEAPAFEDMGDGHTFCATCCSAVAGSPKYDDRIEF